ncbi:MAG TPA: DNA polymerase III subunit epsilon, partial [Reyranella sp.]|nr:DNA polymerase III subunit epsilon [Reyranella sp.]
MREIVLDTETTGLDPLAGHRVVEVGCIELVNTVATGKTFHAYFNPEMIMPAGAQDIHGLSDEFLADKSLFADKVEEFLEFVGDAQLVIHNAQFDIGFLNAELERVGKGLVARERLIDTLLLARRKHPAGPNRLDDLCGRYGIDNSRRTKHGALLDAELLAEVYLELIGARQAQLILVETGGVAAAAGAIVVAVRARPQPLPPRLTEGERAAHLAFVASLGEGAIWRDYLSVDRRVSE